MSEDAPAYGLRKNKISRVLVCGGRDFSDARRLAETMNALHLEHEFGVVIHGAARGADSLADSWARRNGIQTCACPALWDKHGNAAGPQRNRAMLLLQPQLVVAFPGGAGTASMISLATDAGVPVIRVERAAS